MRVLNMTSSNANIAAKGANLCQFIESFQLPEYKAETPLVIPLKGLGTFTVLFPDESTYSGMASIVYRGPITHGRIRKYIENPRITQLKILYDDFKSKSLSPQKCLHKYSI